MGIVPLESPEADPTAAWEFPPSRSSLLLGVLAVRSSFRYKVTASRNDCGHPRLAILPRFVQRKGLHDERCAAQDRTCRPGLGGNDDRFRLFQPRRGIHRVLARHGVEVSPAQVRGPMGKSKKDHLRDPSSSPRRVRAVAAAAREGLGRGGPRADRPGGLRPAQLDAISAHDRLIPGLLPTVAAPRLVGSGSRPRPASSARPPTPSPRRPVRDTNPTSM